VIDWNTNASALAQTVRANVNALWNPTGGLSPGSANVLQRDSGASSGPVTATVAAHTRRSISPPSLTNHGVVSLTHVLAAAIQNRTLTSLEPSAVVPLLSSSLQWRIRSMSSGPVNATDVGGLEIVVHSRSVTPAKSNDEFPVYHEYELHHNITAGQAGGSTFIVDVDA